MSNARIDMGMTLAEANMADASLAAKAHNGEVLDGIEQERVRLFLGSRQLDERQIAALDWRTALDVWNSKEQRIG